MYNKYESRWNLIQEILELQKQYHKLYTSSKITKSAICELVVPFRDKYELSDVEALNIAKEFCSMERIVRLAEKLFP
ncbi:hypothetical protein [Ruminococcus albus]|uniref:hypothetical protein n=1 Tax=Ruminococcus albus TaxID=1264 RepID=UPI0001E0BACD|nr:hypothetical protein [Ruminococcus albus]